MPDFPDHSAQEEPIRTVGDAELLYKRGERILRVNRGRWGTEKARWKYKLLAPYATGRALHAGLGMGVSAEEILARTEITELVCYELIEDVATVYTEEHDADGRLIIEAQDAHEHKPSGMFDLVLYELPMDSQAEYDKSRTYLQWAWAHMNDGGHIVLPHDRFSVALVDEFPQLQPVVLSAQYRAEGVKTSLRPQQVWIVVTK